MEKILIFTNYSSLNSVNSEQRKLKCIPLIQVNPYIAFNEKTKTFQITQSINDGSIFFIQDEITVEDFNGFLGEYDKSQIGVLKHRQPTFTFDKPYKCEPHGIHEADGKGKFYPDVLKIITTDDSKDKFSQLQMAIWNTDNAEQDKEKSVKAFLQENIYNGNIPNTLPNELSEYHAAYDKFKCEVNALSKEEKSLTNLKYSCLIKLLKRDLGL